ncbi:NHLP family bacteriocin export ABC transporter peptidase/permease/ATPase subunit [soil metagenome]
MASSVAAANAPARGKRKAWHERTPTIFQMEAVECGAASLAMILSHYRLEAPLEELRINCGVSRDGSTAKNILIAARKYGLTAQGWKKELDGLWDIQSPAILFWNFNHFVVLEGVGDKGCWLNDPALGRRSVSWEEMDIGFSGVVLTFERSPAFVTGGQRPSVGTALRRRLASSETAMIFLVLCGLAMVVPGLVIPTFSRIFVDSVLVAHVDGWLRPLLIAMTLTLLLRLALGYVQQQYIRRLQTKLLVTNTTEFFEHVLHLPIEFFAQRYAGDIATRVGLNDQVALFMARRLANAAINGVLAIFFMLLMFAYSVPLTLVGVVVVALIVVVTRYVGTIQSDGSKRLLQEQGKVSGVAMGGLTTIETLKATGGETDLFARWAGYVAKTVTISQRLDRSTIALSAIPGLLNQMTFVIILCVGGSLVMNGQMTMGELVAFQSLMASFLAPIVSLSALATDSQSMAGNLARLDDVLRYDIDSRSVAREEDVVSAFAGERLRGEVELRNVTFGYSVLAPPLIEGFNLHLKPGARVAFVGGSGSGKSTLAKLISGLYKPWSGEILFDGQPISALPGTTFTSSVSMVDQDISMYQGTLRDNLTLWDRTVPDAEIVHAAKDALIHNEIAARAGGYSGAVQEGGTNFSGGQRQRLEIARALAIEPRVLILDEATSALDPLTEQRIEQHLRRRGCTCIVVAHRLSTIRDADEIIVMQKGKVVQRGSHDALMREDEGLYAQLARS